jgi:hypothetical protein
MGFPKLIILGIATTVLHFVLIGFNDTKNSHNTPDLKHFSNFLKDIGDQNGVTVTKNVRMLQDFDDSGDSNSVYDVEFFSTWSSPSGTPYSNYFENSNGKAYYYQDDGAPNTFNFVFYDGQYKDQKVAEITIDFNNITDYQGNSTWANNQTEFFVALGDDLNLQNSVVCNGSYSLVYLDTTTPNQVASNITDISDVSEMNINFAVSASNISESSCNFNIVGTGSANDSNFQSSTMKYSIMVTVICVVHLYACIQMIKVIAEHDGEGKRISLLTVGFLTTWDVYLCLFHLSAALTVYNYFHYFITPAFWYFILASIFETRLILILWKSRYYDLFQNMAELRRGIISFYIKFYGLMALVLILSYYFIPQNWFMFLTSFFFVPQIVHNAIRGQRYKFWAHYIFLLGVVRITIPLYVRACPANIFELTPSWSFLSWYCTMVGLQVLILFLQSKLGSRFFVPACFLPPKYNYFITISTETVEGEEADACPICMDNLNKEPVDPTAQLMKPSRTTKIMQTPCRHKFHPICLQEWMNIKLECPFCRQHIPPLE